MVTQVSVWNGPDWSFLPAELIQLISEKIVFKEQYDQFRSVCQQWRRACPPHPFRRIGQCPWILLAREKSSSIMSFCDFSQDKIYKSNLPDVVGKRTIACSRGWILLEKDLELSLINPITGELKSNCLPSLAAPPTILEFARNEKTKDPSQLSYRSYSSKIILTSSPCHVSCCIVVAQFRSLWELGFCRVGDKSWTILKLTEEGHPNRGISDFVYRNGLVYAIKDRGQVIVYDLQNLSQKILIGNLSYARLPDDLYLVIGVGEFDGVPLLVRHVGSRLKGFQVYRCANERARSRWRRVRNIGNVVLLIGDVRKRVMVPFDNIQLNGWRGNQIYYFTKQYNPSSSRSYSIKINRVSIENDTKEVPVLLSQAANYVSFFTPSLS